MALEPGYPMTAPALPVRPYLDRTIAATFRERLGQFQVVVVTGIRQAGKTTLVRRLLPDWDYVTLEDLDQRRFADQDPRGFLAEHPGRTIIDEFQRVPALTSYLQGAVDRTSNPGQYVLTGSQSYLLQSQVSQSLAGRVALLVLLPFSLAEVPHGSARPGLDAVLFRGGFPAVVAWDLPPAAWYSSYVSTYVERDVRQVLAVRDLIQFQTFLKLVAARVGQLLNLSSLAVDAAISVPTARQWLSVLEAGHVIRRVAPWFENAGKRLVKTPKLYFADTGLLCRLLGVESPSDLARHPQRGAVFENWVLTEILKAWHHRGEDPPVWFWRDTEGHEVDFLVHRAGRLHPIEVKAGTTVQPDFFKGLRYLAAQDAARGVAHGESATDGVVVFAGDARQTRGGLSAVPWRELPVALDRMRG